MLLILAAKTLHIISATIFFGAGLMSAWWKLRGDRSGDVRVIAFAQREIVLADWVFTVPSGFISPLTGAYLVHAYSLPWTTDWVVVSIGGFVVATVCWLPAAALQVKLKRMADEALAQGTPLPAQFHRYNRVWLLLGVPAFAAAVGIIWTMVAKRVGLS